MTDHCPADPASPRRLRGMHALQLGVAAVQPLQRPDSEKLAIGHSHELM
jgi:hypothetical protein